MDVTTEANRLAVIAEKRGVDLVVAKLLPAAWAAYSVALSAYKLSAAEGCPCGALGVARCRAALNQLQAQQAKGAAVP